MKTARIAILALALTSVAALAGDAKLTIYDDGLSCPASCDSHVVFHPSLKRVPNLLPRVARWRMTLR